MGNQRTKGKSNLMRIGARVRSLNRTRPCRLPEQEPRLSHLWQFNFSNSEGTKKAEWRNSNWLVFDSTICSRATEKSRIVCSYSHPGLIRYQQSRLWPCRGRFQKADAKRRKRSKGQDCKCLSIGAPCKLLEHSFQCSFVKDCNKTHRNFCFCIIFAKFAYSTPNFIQNDLEQWIICIITA